MAAAWGKYIVEYGDMLSEEERIYALRKYAHFSTNGWELPQHAQGGVVDYTGIAMLHGTKQRSETVFNANDSKKLYDLVHRTPNLMADMYKQAMRLASVSTRGITTNNAQTVSIGAVNVYANNPQEFARNLDKTLDNYFRTKLTQSYTGK